MMTREPAQKTERLVLYGDKRLGAGKALVEGNKKSLGMTTITKAAKYLQQAVGELGKIENKDTRNIMENKVRLSTQKHMEVLEEIKDKAGESNQKPWEESYRIVGEVQKALP